MRYAMGMKATVRSVKRTRVGKYARATVRSAVRAVHVLEAAPGGKWDVRTLGERGQTEVFDLKETAIERAFKIGKGAKVVVHHRDPKKVTLVRPQKTAEGMSFREVKLR